MGKLLDKLLARRTLIADGAWGTMLPSAGLPLGTCPEQWNLEWPELVSNIAAQYAAAGAELLGTNSFGGNVFRLRSFGLEAQVRELNFAAATLSREAAGADQIVLGTIGPSGERLDLGEVTREALHAAFHAQAEALCAGGADALCIETMSLLEEAEIAVRAARDCGVEVICSFTFQPQPGGTFCTLAGHTPSEVAAALENAGVDVLGVNCGHGTAGMADVVRQLHRAAPHLPIMAQPSAGFATQTAGSLVYAESPEHFAAHVPALLAAGARIIGGCCGTTPEYIRRIAECLKATTQPK